MAHETNGSEDIAACGDFVALVLARDAGTSPLCVLPNEPGDGIAICTGSEGTPAARPLQLFKGETLVRRTVSMLSECGFRAIEVSAAKDDRLLAALEQELADIPCATICAHDAAREARAAEEHSYFEAFGLGAETLERARTLALAHGAEGVIVIPCDLANFRHRHAKRLVDDFHAHPQAEIVASWIAWLNRPPYLLRTSFLESFDKAGLCARREGRSHRPLPLLNVHETVFDMEMLSAQPSASNPEEGFFADCTISALEAVRLVRKEQAVANGAAAFSPADESPLSAQMNAAFAGKAPSSSRSSSDEALLSCARAVLAKLDSVKAALSRDERDDLARWDAWAHRNKLDFPLFTAKEHGTLVYLDSAATSQRVGRALDAQYRYDAYENANVYRGAYKLSAQATATYNDARAVLERHLGAKRRSAIYTMNASSAAALAASSWGEENIGPGDRILVPINEHHSNILPWMLLARRKGARIDYIPIREDGRIDIEAYRGLLGEQPAPKLVCVAHVTNVLGLVNPVSDMAEAAHAVGARVFVDAAQSFAHFSLDVNQLGADFLALSAHKAYGPMGLGVLWASEGAYGEMEPQALGGGTVSHAATDSYYPREGAICYELGTPAVSQAVGFAAAIDYLDGLGMDAVEGHGAALTGYLSKALDTFPGVTVWGDHSENDGLAGLVSFTQAGIPPKTVASVMGRLNVAVRAGGHCALPLHASMALVGSIRFSLAVHSTVEDVEAGLVALELARRIYRRPEASACLQDGTQD